MPLAYTPPGVRVSETITPSVSPLLAVPAQVCLVGLTQGFQTLTDQFVISGTTAVPLPSLPTGATLTSVVSVKDALNPSKGATDGSGYVVTTDYTISTANGTITRVGAGGIADGTLINVTYNYVPANYFQPTRLTDLGSVESRYGSGVDPTGTIINSPLSYAASIAFENGADSIVCQPLFVRTTPGDASSAVSQPTATQAAVTTTWADTLYVLRDIDDINVVVPVIGQSMTNVTDAIQLAVEQTVQDYIQFMNSQQQYVVALLGEDNSVSSTVATQATLQAHAATLRGRYAGASASQLVLVSPAKFTRALPAFGRTVTLGGQYAAAAVAGMLAARPTSAALTRKVVSGFISIADSRDLQQKNADAAAGLLVLEQKGGLITVRHGKTIDTSSTQNAELSVVRAKHRMIESLRDTIDRQIIGQIIADDFAVDIVQTTVIAVLELLRQQRELVDYSGVQARLTSIDPTLIEVRFSYRPAFPLNYVNIIFSIDLTQQTVNFNAANLTLTQT